MRHAPSPLELLELRDFASVLLVGPREIFGRSLAERAYLRRAQDVEAALRRFRSEAGAMSSLRLFFSRYGTFLPGCYDDGEMVRMFAREATSGGLTTVRLPIDVRAAASAA